MRIKPLYKTIIIVCILVFCGLMASAQLSLDHTNWGVVSADKITLHFEKDTVLVQNLANSREDRAMFLQKHDTLLIFSRADKSQCPADTGFYQIKYQYSGQQLQLNAISEKCTYRTGLFSNRFSYLFGKNSAARNWPQLDISTDSVAGISLYKAYELLKGRNSKTIIVAVIDNGFDIEHEDLKDIIWTNTKEIPGNGIDDDHNGYTDDVHGWNFRSDKGGNTIANEQSAATQMYAALKSKYDHADLNQLNGDEQKQLGIYKQAKAQYLETLNHSKDTADIRYAYNIRYNSGRLINDGTTPGNDQHYGSPFITATPNLSHGTHVAGIIAAKRNNQKGIDGIADNVLIMPIIATTAIGDERDKDVANAIRYAVDNGARIINMSFSKRFSPYKNLVDEAIRYAEKKHVLIIHAAGNDGNNNDTANYYPVPYYNDGRKASNFITVGWSRPLLNYRLAHPYSGYGKNNVDVFAPGSDVFSTIPGNLYDYKSGSSMSTPCVTGVAALLFSYFPGLTMEQVKNIILRSSF